MGELSTLRRGPRDVAQLGSALDWGSRGRRFKSCHPDRSEGVGLRAGPFAVRAGLPQTGGMTPRHPVDDPRVAAIHPVDPSLARARRLIAGVALALVICAGLAVHAILPDTAASDIAGDTLYAVAAYLAVLLVAPRLHPLVVGAIAAGWCVAVELFQLTGVPLELGAAFRPVMLLLGTVFDPRDLLVYVATVVAITMIDAGMRRVGTRARTS